MDKDISFVQVIVAAAIAFFGRELIPLAVYAFDDSFVGWLCLFVFLLVVVLMFNYGNRASSEKERNKFYRDRCRQLELENEALKTVKEREHQERKN